MCGIAGLYHFCMSKPVEKTVLRSLCDAIKHRGPDDEGMYLTSQVGLGMRRLAVIDLVTGHQPLCNENKTVWIVFNGEIYNYRELREKLAPRHTFSTQSDTEVIVHLYEDYGESCVDHLRGMFAFAIWDSTLQRMFFARDRLGKKPLYYALNNGVLVFASEIPALVKYLPHKPAINHQALDLYLTYQYIPSPHTIFDSIMALPPAHTMTCDRRGAISTRRYWDIDFRRKTTLSFSEACDRTYELLRESTRLRMIADVPLGAFLSGGHDSSIVVGLMSQLSQTPVKTFSIGFDESDFSELSFARLVADRFKTDHHEIIVRPHFIDLLPEIARRYGQPFADASALPSYIVARETRKQVTVALNGDGGDEAFGGYKRYLAMKGSSLVALPFRVLGKAGTQFLARSVACQATGRAETALRNASRFVDGLSEPPDLRMVRYASFFTDELKERVYSPSFKKEITIAASSYLSTLFLSA
ncbi:MAG: asparagine synthase (glutamine-hydrolyzing), partial [Endomicrobiales bacterium]